MRWWTDEEKEALRGYIEQCLSGDQVARAMSAQFNRPFTRSMVNSAAIRAGLKLICRPHHRVRKAEPPAVNGAVAPKPPAPTPIVPPDLSHACTIWELTRGRCHYPLWPDQYKAHPSFPYCGAKANNSPYCEIHERVVYRTMPEQFQRKRLGLIANMLR